MFNLQMYYTLSTINFTKKLLSNIHGLQRDNVLCDLKIVCDNGEVWIHRPALESRKVCWCSLLRDSATNVVLLPGISKLEVEKFVGNIYGEFKFSYDDDIEPFNGFTDSDIDIAESRRLGLHQIHCNKRRTAFWIVFFTGRLVVGDFSVQIWNS